LQPLNPPVLRRVRAFFAPVNRATGQPTFFDPAQISAFKSATPAPWIDLGWIENFARKSASKVTAVRAGAPAATQMQVRQELEATVAFRFASWGKLQLALAAGSEQMNALATASGSAAAPSGGTAAAAFVVQAGSTATVIELSASANASVAAGDVVAVDANYTGQTGWLGAGVSGAYVVSAAAIGSDVDYIRRTTLNVGQVASVSGSPVTAVTLGAPLIGGAPAAGTGMQVVVGFVDRDGGSFFQEWSALFLAEGEQGDFVCFHYPRLQAMQAGAESQVGLSGPISSMLLDAQFRALPVADPNDGAQILCFRSYIPAAAMNITGENAVAQ
jgi:hypothetical protein